LKALAAAMGTPLRSRECKGASFGKSGYLSPPGVRYEIGGSYSPMSSRLLSTFGIHKEGVLASFSHLDISSAAAFLSGFLDGDGSVSSYPGGAKVTFVVCPDGVQDQLLRGLLTTLGVYWTEHREPHTKFLVRFYIASKPCTVKLKSLLYQGSLGYEYKKHSLASAELSSRFRSISKAERQSIISRLEKDHAKGVVDLEALSSSTGLALDTLRGYYAPIRRPGYSDTYKDRVSWVNSRRSRLSAREMAAEAHVSVNTINRWVRHADGKVDNY